MKEELGYQNMKGLITEAENKLYRFVYGRLPAISNIKEGS